MKTIKLGSKGSDVVAWQRIVNVTADGVFGNITDAATRNWQALHGLLADGIVGKKTWGLALSLPDISVPVEQPNVICELVKKYVGCSLKNRTDELAQLVARGVDDPKQAVQIKTNCGMFCLGIWHAVGVKHKLLETRYISGQAIAWVRKIAIDLNALNKFDHKHLPGPGSILHYYTNGKNNNHVEFLLSDIDELGYADHGGGGRTDNAITMATHENVMWSVSRPLQEWIDAKKLLSTE